MNHGMVALMSAVALVAAEQARADCVSVGHTGFGIASQPVEVCRAAQMALSADQAAEASSGKDTDLSRATKEMNRRIALTKLSGQLATLGLLVANAGVVAPLGYETGEIAFDAKVLALAEQR